MSYEIPDPDLRALAGALTGLELQPARLDRDQLMYLAGRAAARRASWLWPTTTALFGLATLGLFLVQFPKPEPVPQERIVYVTPPDSKPLEPASPVTRPPISVPESPMVVKQDRDPSGPSFLKIRQEVLTGGVEAMLDPPPMAVLPSLGSPETLPDLPVDPADRSFLMRGHFSFSSGGHS